MLAFRHPLQLTKSLNPPIYRDFDYLDDFDFTSKMANYQYSLYQTFD